MSLVPYAAGFAGSNLALSAKRARVAYDYGRRYAPEVARAATTIGRMYRRYKRKRGRYGIGARTVPGARTRTKAYNPSPTTSATSLQLGKLLTNTLPYPLPSDTNVPNRRQEMAVLIKGWKLCRDIYYTAPRGQTGDIGPIEVHYCLFQLKCPNPTPGSYTGIESEFFRDNSGGVNFSKDFDGYTDSSPWSMHFNCCPVNPNNDFKILMHKKKILYQRPPAEVGDAAPDNARNYWRIRKYMKVNRNTVFENDTSSEPKQPIFEALWVNTCNPSDFPSNPATWFGVSTVKHHVVYFDDAK